MKKIIYKYDSDNERVTIKADNTVVGELREIKVDNLALVIKSTMEMFQQVYNFKNKTNGL